MKAVISDRIYLNCEEGTPLYNKICEALTYSIDRRPQSIYPEIIRNAVKVTDKVLSMPSGRLDLVPEDYKVIDKRVDCFVDIPAPSFTLRENQEQAVQAMLEKGGLINAKPSWGKTIAALGLAHKLGRKTLVVTTTTTIRDMWVNEIREHFGFEAGIMGSGKLNTEPPIVVGNIATIRNKIDKYTNEFGLVIVDEVHRSPAKTFTDTLNKVKARYRVGLSGTLERKDGLHCVLPDYFGTEVFVAKDENRLVPEIHMYKTGIELSANEFIPWANVITKVMTNPTYQRLVIELAKQYARQGYKVLVLCDRVELLEVGWTATQDNSVIITGKVSGIEERQKILDAINDYESGADILWGTQSIFSEGVSAKELSCVILASPINNEPLLDQIIGRVQRKSSEKKKTPPIVVDLGFVGGTGNNQRNKRTKFYIEKGWRFKNK
jgi:superfamily II DNA or RNA helicase